MTATFIPYQIDYAVTNAAKTLGFSKKKVLFKFGFANKQAVEDGAAGAQCRGSEHELTFIWSLKTGKRQLFLDGKDVHFSESGQNGWVQDRAWQHAFTMKDPTGVYRVHFISQPKNPEMPDSKPFDLRVAGVSYFSFNRIFMLGTPNMVVRENSRDDRGTHRHLNRRDSPMTAEERRQIAAAKVESLRELRQNETHQHHHSADSGSAPPMQKKEVDLLSFGDDPPAPPQPGMPPVYGNQFANPPQQQQQAFGQQPGGQPQFAQPPPDFRQSAPAMIAYGQQPVYGQQQQPGGGGDLNALTTYQPPAGQPAPSPYAMPYQQQQPPPPQQQSFQQHSVSLDSSGFQQQFGSPSGQTYASYGTAPSFAHPPRPPQGGSMTTPSYSAPVPAPGDSFGYSPQQQQQQLPNGYPMQQQQPAQPQQQQPAGGNPFGAPAPAPYPGYPTQNPW